MEQQQWMFKDILYVKICAELMCVLSDISSIQLLKVAYVGRVVSVMAVCRYIHVLRPNDESR